LKAAEQNAVIAADGRTGGVCLVDVKILYIDGTDAVLSVPQEPSFVSWDGMQKL
jgi:hypothetical protein